MSEVHKESTEKALESWRKAEKVAAVAKRGKVAAETAVTVAEDAEAAASATAAAAKAALEASEIAEQSAVKTAASARLLAETTRVDAAEATSEVEQADADQHAAKAHYQEVAGAASDRQRPDGDSPSR